MNTPRKIYNEVVLRWNDKTNSFDTIYEDSYVHKGDIHELQRSKTGNEIISAADGKSDGDEYSKGFNDTFKDLGKSAAAAMKKAAKTGANDFRTNTIKALAGMGVSIQGILENAVDVRIGKGLKVDELAVNDIGKEMAQMAEGAMSGMIDADEMATAWESLEARLIKTKIGKVAISKMKKDWERSVEAMNLEAIEKNMSEAVEGGVSSALDFIPENALTKALGIDAMKKKIGKEMAESIISDELTEKFKGFGDTLGKIAKDHWGKIIGAALAVGLAVWLINGIRESTDEIGDSFGAIGVTEFKSELMFAKAEAQMLGYDLSNVSSVVGELATNFGIGFGEATKMSGAVLDTAKALAISEDTAGKLTGMFMAMGGHTAESAQNLLKQGAALAFSAGVAPSAIMEDIAESSEQVAGFTKGAGDNIFQAAVKARQLGMSLGDVANIAEGLLDFQSSLEAEMTASVMIGRQLNLQKARELSLAGDLEGLQDELLKQVGSQTEFNELNILQRKALADALGMEVSQMGKMVKMAGMSNKELARMGEGDISKIVGDEAISDITEFFFYLDAIKTSIFGGIAAVSGWFNSFGEGWTMVGPILTLLGIAILGIGLYLGATALSAYATGAGLKAAGVGATAAGGGLASMAVAGTAAIPLLLTIALVGASVALIFASIGYVLSKLPPVIDSIASGFVLVAQAITGSLLKLATPEMVLGIMGLAGAFWMLAGALVAVGVAGLVAAPGLAVVAGFTAAMYALGKAGNANDKQSETELIKNELQTLNTAVIKLIENFDKKYIPAIVASNIEGAKGAGKSLGRQLAGI